MVFDLESSDEAECLQTFMKVDIVIKYLYSDCMHSFGAKSMAQASNSR